jgi:sulfur-oxidizing protein SoxA
VKSCAPFFIFITLLASGKLALALEQSAQQGQSSYVLMSPENKAMQDDSSLNPAFFWIMDGKALWQTKIGKNQIACASCHGESGEQMRGVATGFPKMIKGKLQTLESQINRCRVDQQKDGALPFESKALLALTVFIANQSKGMPIHLQETRENAKDLAQGRHLFNDRMGQLNLSCAQCHQDHAGSKLGGSFIPQAHPTGYPIYRIEWQTLGSLQRRLRNCMSGVRAQQFEYGSLEMAQLELFLMWRARGMTLETPAVRP